MCGNEWQLLDIAEKCSDQQIRWPDLRAPGRNRTCDSRLRRSELYPLSYEGVTRQRSDSGVVGGTHGARQHCDAGNE